MANTENSQSFGCGTAHVRFLFDIVREGRRRFTAIESRQIGRGGIAYVAEVLGCSRRTIRRGLDELDQLLKCRHGNTCRSLS